MRHQLGGYAIGLLMFAESEQEQRLESVCRIIARIVQETWFDTDSSQKLCEGNLTLLGSSEALRVDSMDNSINF